MSYVLLFLYTCVICVIIYRTPFFKSDQFPKYIPIALFLSKFAMGVGLIWVYLYYYNTRISADVLKYFDDGNIIFSAIYENPLDYLRMLTGIASETPHLMQYYDTCFFWFKEFNYGLINDNRIVIRFNAFFRLFSMGNIYIHTLFLSFFSFTGLWAILKIFIKEFRQKWLLILVVFFFPSLWFWSSGLLKEGIITGAFGLLFYHLFQTLNNGTTIKRLIGIGAMFFLLLISKFYILLAALPGFVILIVLKLNKNKKPWLVFCLSYLGFLTLIYFSEYLSGISVIDVLEQKQMDFIRYVKSLPNVGSYYDIPDLQPTMWSFLITSPKAFFTTLLRPTIFEANNPMMLMAAIENVIIFTGILLSIVFFKKENLNKGLFLFSISFVLILFTLSGLTTPVLGALVRYKAPALPFLGIIMLYLINFEKLSQPIGIVQNFFTKNK